MTEPAITQAAATIATLDEKGQAEQRIAVATQWQLMWWRFRKHKLAVGGTLVLALFYLVALFADFFAYADPNESDAQRSLIAPQEIHWFDEGRFSPYIYGLKGTRDPRTFKRVYVPDPTKKVPLSFFAQGEPYEFLGFIPMERYLIGVEGAKAGDVLFLLGTDTQGRDMWSRLMYATQTSMTIGLVSVADHRLLRIVKAGSDPEQTAISQDGSRLFVANEDVGEASVVAVDDGHVLASLKVGGEPEGVELRPDGRVVYVTSEEDSHVAVIDTTALKVLKTIGVGPRPRSTAFLPDSTRAYVPSENGSSVAVIDAMKHEVLDTIKLTGQLVRPMGVVAAPDGKHIFVTTGRGKTVMGLVSPINVPSERTALITRVFWAIPLASQCQPSARMEAVVQLSFPAGMIQEPIVCGSFSNTNLTLIASEASWGIVTRS